MIKKLLLLLVIVSFNSTLFGQFSFDTLESRQVAPGIIYKKLTAPSVPLLVYMLKIDLQNPKVKIKTAKAMNLVKQFKLGSQTVGPVPILPLSQIISENNPNNEVIAAVNGDFFTEEGRPYNIQIMQGQMLQAPNKSVVLGLDENSNAFLGRLNFSSSIVHRTKVTRVDTTVSIDGLNNFRQADQMWLYNGFIGSEVWPDSLPRSGQNRWAPEIIIEPLSPWAINDTIKCVVKGVSSLTLPDTVNRFPVGWACLSQHRNNDDWFAKVVSKGDTLKLNFNLTAVAGYTGLSHPVEMIGGTPQIVKNNVNYVEQGYVDENIVIDPLLPHHSKELHPRTVTGLSQDKRYLYLIAVDGGQPTVSKGVTLAQMADILISFNIPNAMNLDGGENTTMIVENNLVNQPALGTESPISNAILVLSTGTSDIETEKTGPTKFELQQNYPNPFNPVTKINYQIPFTSNVTLKIYNILGNLVEILVNEKKQAGAYHIDWNASKFPSGTYFYELRVNESAGKEGNRIIKKMILIK